MGGVNLPISVIKLPVTGFRRQLTQGGVQAVPYLTIASAVVFAITAWTMTAAPQRCGIVHRLPQEPHPPRRAHDAAGIPPPALRVVSKCALRDKRNGTFGFPNAPRSKYYCKAQYKKSSNFSKSISAAAG